jgi:outer membrane protein TolC
MSGTTSGNWPISRRWTVGFLALGFITLGSVRADDIRVLPPPIRASADAKDGSGSAVPKFSLDSLRATALLHNSSIAVAKASLAAAVAGQQGVDNLRIPTFLQPDLPFRRKQACLGVQAAEAGVRQAELLTIFGVQYAYVSVLYAQEQERIATKAGVRLDEYTKSVKDVRKDPGVKTDLRVNDEIFLESLQLFAASKLVETRSGTRRALSALREAMGVGCDVPLEFEHGRLLDVKPTLDRKALVELALANRPELLQASINVQVTELEVQAQKSRHSLNVRTFASGADLHANPLPAGRYDTEYRPGAIGPEMPPFLSGKKCDRVARASAYLGRAVSLLERTRTLITLEVEQAFFRYQETTEKFESLTKGASILRKAADDREKKLKNAFFGDGSIPVLYELLEYSRVLAQMRAQANEARYQQLIALITLERATGAAFRAALSGAPEVKDE